MLEERNTTVAPPGRRSTRLTTGAATDTSALLPAEPNTARRRRQDDDNSDDTTRKRQISDQHRSPERQDNNNNEGRQHALHKQQDMDDNSTQLRGRQRERAMQAGHQSRTPSYSGNTLDIKMHSPPKDPIPAYGSSRSAGGSLRGRAVGNTFNIADAEQVWSDVNRLDVEPTKGKIYIYISDLNPAVVDIAKSSFIANVYDIAKCQTVQDLMKRGSRDYSPIRRPAYRLFIRDEDDWCAHGRYESIINRTSTAEDYIKWMKDDENNKYFIRILGTTFDPSSSLYLPGFAGRSSSLGSRSVSGSRSDTPPSQMPTFQQGPSNPFTFTGRNMSDTLRNRLVEELGIDIYFTNRSSSGLRFCWGRYLAITKAIEQAQSTFKAGSWPSDLPAFNEVLIVEVFISKSAWYNQKNSFALVQKHYPNMVVWLDQDISDQDEDEDVWGEYREKYKFEDLKEYLDLGGRLKKSRMSSRARSSDDDRVPNKGKGKSHKKKYN